MELPISKSCKEYKEKTMIRMVTKSEAEDIKISIAIMSSFVILTFQYLILLYFDLMGTRVGQGIQLISKGVVGFLYLQALPIVLRRNKSKVIVSYFIAIFFVFINYALYRENWEHIKTIIFPLFFTCIPSFIYSYSIKDWHILKKIMDKASVIVIILGLLIGIIVVMGKASIGDYSMSLSYYMLLPAIIFIDRLIIQRSLINGVGLAASLLIILALGSRGAILCIGIYAFLRLARFYNKVIHNKTLLFVSMITTFLIIGGYVFFFDEILQYIYRVLGSIGIKSRSISLLLRDSIHLSGRDVIYKKIIGEISSNPIIGIGLAGDRRILAGGYSHNILIEILSNFGIVIGSLIIVLLLFLIIRSMFTRVVTNYNMIIMWVSIGFVHLLISSSYLIDFKFWILMGLILSRYTFRSFKEKQVQLCNK
jgi:hypothetical protein